MGRRRHLVVCRRIGAVAGDRAGFPGDAEAALMGRQWMGPDANRNERAGTPRFAQDRKTFRYTDTNATSHPITGAARSMRKFDVSIVTMRKPLSAASFPMYADDWE